MSMQLLPSLPFTPARMQFDFLGEVRTALRVNDCVVILNPDMTVAKFDTPDLYAAITAYQTREGA